MKYNADFQGVIDMDNVTEEDFFLMTGGLNLKECKKNGRYLSIIPINIEDVDYSGFWKDRYKNSQA